MESDRLAAFSPEDAELLEFFASSAAVSIEKALLHRQVLEKQRIEDQLKVAREVQSGLLPGAPPRLRGYDIAAVAAHLGDRRRLLRLRAAGSGRLGLVIADVSGKGIPAALIMATFRAALRTEMRRHADLRAVADQLNVAVLESGDTSRFVTAVCGVLDSTSGRLTYVNCGHDPPLLLRASGGAESLPSGRAGLGSLRRGGVRGWNGRPRARATAWCSTPTGSSSPRRRRRGVRDGAARRRRARGGRPPGGRRPPLRDRRHPRLPGRDDYDDDFTLVVVQREMG